MTSNIAPAPPTYPGPPIVGHLWQLQNDPLGLFSSPPPELGGVVRLTALHRDAILIRSPSAVQHVLLDNWRNYSIALSARMALRHWLGEGLFTIQGELWRERRHLLQPLFHRHIIQDFSNMMVMEAQQTAHRWLSEGQVNVQDEMLQLTLRIISRVLGIPLGTHIKEFSQCVTEMVNFYGDWLRGIVTSQLPKSLMKYHPRFRSALKTIDRIIYDLIALRRNRNLGERDFLSLLIQARDEHGSPLSDQAIRDEVMSMLLAGHETTAVSLTWILYLLGTHEAVREQVEAELTSLDGHLPAVEDLLRLPYLEALVREGLRLYPPFWAMFRVPLVDDVIEGFHIRAGARIVVSPWVVHRSPLWHHPERFDPTRWLAGGEALKQPKFAYFPFGGGPRACLGKHFALMEIPLVIATLLQEVRLTRADRDPVAPEGLLTLHPSRPIIMLATAR